MARTFSYEMKSTDVASPCQANSDRSASLGCAAVTWVGFFRDARRLTWLTKTHSHPQESAMAARPVAANETREERIEAIIKELRPKIDAAVRKLVERAVDVPEAEEFGAIDFEFRDAGQEVA